MKPQIKCYHARRVQLTIDSDALDFQLFIQGPVVAPLIATIDSDEEPLEDIWDCCNNSCWCHRKDWYRMRNYKNRFRVKFTDDYRGYCNDDLIVEMNSKFYVAKSSGWTSFKFLSDAIVYCAKNAFWCKIYSKSDQYPIGKAVSMDDLESYKKQYETKGFDCSIY